MDWCFTIVICFWAKNFFTGNEQPTCEARNVLWHISCLKTLQNIAVETLVDHLPCWKIFIVQNTFYVKKIVLILRRDSLAFSDGEMGSLSSEHPVFLVAES